MELLKRIALILLALFLVFISAWALFAPKENFKESISKTLQQQKEKADLFFKGVTFSEIDDGNKYWELNAKESWLNKTTGLALLKEVEGTFFQKGKPTLNFVAPLANWNMNQKEITLEKPIGFDAAGNIKPNQILTYLAKIPQSQNLSVFSLRNKYVSGLGNIYWFKANALDWKLANQKIICRGGILLSKGDISIQANELEGDVSLEKAKLSGSPFADIVPQNNKQEKTHILADEFLLDSKLNEVLADKNVEIDHFDPTLPYHSLKIKCQTASYNQMTQALSLSESVEAFYGDISAFGKTAYFFPDKQIIELSGEAYAIYQGSRINGENVLVRLKQRKVTVSGRSKVIVKKEVFKK